ncbi:MAG: hypothetical protein GY847_24340 [Proteobacteria bacterium]|nr:hypothetical protein [Pseudomonadota bacterium]
MHETKKLRKVVPITVPNQARDVDLWNNHDLLNLKKPPINPKIHEDSWAELLGEAHEQSRLVYDKGSWNFTDEIESQKETRDGIKRPELPITRVTRIPGNRRKIRGS